MFARRAGWDLTANAYSERVAARRRTGLPVVDLTESNPTRCGIRASGAALARALEALAGNVDCLRYEPDPRGAIAAREAIARYHVEQGARLDAASVVLTSGTSEGYAHLFRLLADPGARVLVPEPSYPLFDLLAGLESVEVAPYPLRWRAGRWRIDLEALESAAASGARALLVVHPNNPTGSLASAEEISAVRALCRDRGLALVSDEVFAAFRNGSRAGLAPTTWLPSAEEAESAPLGFVLSGASKLLALPQLKAAWVAVGGPERLRDEALARLEVIADSFLSVSGLVQHALPGLLADRAAIVAEVSERVAASEAALANVLGQSPHAEILPREGGWSAIVRLRGEPPPDEDALVEALLDGPGVVVHPGWLFDLAPIDDDGHSVAHLVISLLAPPREIERGAGGILAMLTGGNSGTCA